jgi:hypothetical protein
VLALIAPFGRRMGAGAARTLAVLSVLAAVVPCVAQAVATPSTFANLDGPFGVTVGNGGNIFVTYTDTLQTPHLRKFSPSAQQLDDKTIGSVDTDTGRLATDSATGKIWDLGQNGILRLVDPQTLSYSTLKDVKTVDISSSITSAWDVNLDMPWGAGGSVNPDSSSFGDIALYRPGDGHVYAFVTGYSVNSNITYVLRLQFDASQPGAPVYQGATLVVWSSYRLQTHLAEGVAVNPSGLVVATLPRIGRLGTCCTDQAVSFPYDFPKPNVTPTGEMDRWDMYSNGLASDAQGWFYLTGVIGSSKCGAESSAAITVLGTQRDFRACYAHSLLAWGNDVAVTPSGDSAYSTISCGDPQLCTENVVLKWGRLDGFSMLVGTNSGSGLGTVTSTPTGINCPPQCQAVFDPGTTVTLTPQPAAAGYRFDSWSGDCSGTGGCAVTMDAAKGVSARFEAFDAPRASNTSYLSMPLVPDFRQTISNSQCQARGGTPSTHGPPLSSPSCNPPSVLGTRARFGQLGGGYMQVSPLFGDPYNNTSQGDMLIYASAEDIRSGSRTGPAYDPNPYGADMTMVFRWRLSDIYNDLPDHLLPATMIDRSIGAEVSCVPQSYFPGSTCRVATSANTILGTNAFHINRHAVIQVFRTHLLDSGQDNVYGNADDRSFATQGVYVP